MNENSPAILIVDDEAIILMALKQELMTQYGNRYLLETALNARDANEVIEELVQDGVKLILVISDWLMPGMRGDDFLADVKSRHPNVRCIIISGQADPDAIERARIRFQLDAYIKKPWTHRTLIDAVDLCLSA
ncbi:MAG: response regulator [Treponemataceae bacterium]